MYYNLLILVRFMPNGTKPLHEPVLINHRQGLVAFHGKLSKYESLKCTEFENG